MSCRILLPLSLCAVVIVAALAVPKVANARGGKLLVKIIDADTQQPVAARMHLKNQHGVAMKSPGAPFWKDHFAIDGEVTLKLNNGNYTFEVERGPEYKIVTGHFRIDDFADDEKLIEMHRFVNMAKQGWWSGDLHVHRELRDIELLMRADDLHVAPVITWWRNKNRDVKPPSQRKGVVRFEENRVYSDDAGEDERNGGALLFFGLAEPLDLTPAGAEYPSSMKYLLEAREKGATHIDAEKPFWWDAPLWLASGKIDSIGLANNHLWREGVLDNEAWGKPRDKVLFPSPQGNGRWSESIYYHALNAGLRIPPSAGSASGVLPNPVGYNRVYVHCGQDFSYDNWWRNLRAGRVVVTNGPLLRTEVEGELPGHVFESRKGEELEFEVALTLSTRDKIEYLEIVKDGRTLHNVRLDEFKKAAGRLPKVPFTESGWFLIRAVTSNDKTYRYASTGPYYVEYDYGRRISRAAAQFFLDWMDERTKQIQLDDPQQQQEVLEFHRTAREYWQALVNKANAD